MGAATTWAAAALQPTACHTQSHGCTHAGGHSPSLGGRLVPGATWNSSVGVGGEMAAGCVWLCVKERERDGQRGGRCSRLKQSPELGLEFLYPLRAACAGIGQPGGERTCPARSTPSPVPEPQSRASQEVHGAFWSLDTTVLHLGAWQAPCQATRDGLCDPA